LETVKDPTARAYTGLKPPVLMRGGAEVGWWLWSVLCFELLILILILIVISFNSESEIKSKIKIRNQFGRRMALTASGWLAGSQPQASSTEAEPSH
jgi:hypothetical protein